MVAIRDRHPSFLLPFPIPPVTSWRPIPISNGPNNGPPIGGSVMSAKAKKTTESEVKDLPLKEGEASEVQGGKSSSVLGQATVSGTHIKGGTLNI